ncbi:zinc-dependent alcohol dehydrogenase family protein [Parasphingorhabdus sp.]|uniref:zinc-dependent alcohol dehydrogenase family protein n=1 Tax=Parasphingorhabdus sp. TaxID=2709688 RepID=UPI0032641BBC
MKYIQYDKTGDPADVLMIKNATAQLLSSGEVRVRVLAAPIHPANLLQISGEYGIAPELPANPGGEGVGRVVEVAPDVAHLAIGQRVMLAGGATWREEIVAPAAAFVPLPDVGDVEQMSMLTVNPLTAHLILSNFVDLNAGEWIIQSAANSAVGEYLIQLAKERGLKTVNIVRRESLIPELETLGADVVLTDGPDLAERVAEATSNAPISMAVDAVGGVTFTQMVECLAFGGTIVAYGSLSKKPPVLNSIATIFNDVRVRGFWLQKWFETTSDEDRQAAFGAIIPLIASGALKAKIDSRFAIEDIAAAVTRAAESGRSGKVILIPNQE